MPETEGDLQGTTDKHGQEDLIRVLNRQFHIRCETFDRIGGETGLQV